ncbi:uncharacterized protein LOC129591867 [Paramacrobiotus metropolitanus]|uniref:uncharacterized protein LOC129591867 n=1 Tax=Paramacrobiotus metropolitanus TaxID=2943436 RepID=UPI002445F56D|nr:uncharacterized protein LOC129591867 [Paramacrobiotus metropolitanus]
MHKACVISLILQACCVIYAFAETTISTTLASTTTTAAPVSTTLSSSFIPTTRPRPEGRSSVTKDDMGVSELTEERKRQLKREFHLEEAYKKQLAKEEREKQEAATQTTSPKWDAAEQISKSAGFPQEKTNFQQFSPAGPTDPAGRFPVAGPFMQGQSFPMQLGQLLKGNTPNQMQPTTMNQFAQQPQTQGQAPLQQNFVPAQGDMSSLFGSGGALTNIMQPHIGSPQAAGQLIPPLMGSGVQQGLNQLQSRQSNMQSLMQTPQPMTFPAMATNTMPMLQGMGQQPQQLFMQQPNGALSPTGMSAMPIGGASGQFNGAMLPSASGFNSALYGNNQMPLQQQGFMGGQPVNIGFQG